MLLFAVSWARAARPVSGCIAGGLGRRDRLSAREAAPGHDSPAARPAGARPLRGREGARRARDVDRDRRAGRRRGRGAGAAGGVLIGTILVALLVIAAGARATDG